jgi:hypothetical protein
MKTNALIYFGRLYNYVIVPPIVRGITIFAFPAKAIEGHGNL